jgi:hypothetical protein
LATPDLLRSTVKTVTHRVPAGTVSAVLSVLLMAGCGSGTTDSPADEPQAAPKATATVPPPSAQSPGHGTGSIDLAIIAIGYDAWAGSDPAALSVANDLAVFHAPQAGPDEDAHRLWEAADPSSVSLVYQNFGMACNDPAWTTCGIGSTDQARSEGWLATYGGLEAGPSGLGYLTSVDMGKPGYGVAWAQRVAERIGPYSYDGVFFDDVNVADSRLPNRGLPDGYATVTAYKDAVRVQLAAARDYLGGTTAANVGALTEEESFYFPADDLVGVLDYTLVEFCGQWPNVTPQSEAVWDRLIRAGQTAALRGRKLWCGGFGTTQEHARFNDHVARIVGAGAVSLSDGNDYRGPFPAAMPTPRS